MIIAVKYLMEKSRGLPVTGSNTNFKYVLTRNNINNDIIFTRVKRKADEFKT